MKKLVISLVILGLSFVTYINAQDKQENKGRRHLTHKELNLAPDQEEKMKTTGEDFRNKMQELRDDKNLSKEDKQAKMKELTNQHYEDINKILTPEQQIKMKDLRDKRPVNMRQGNRSGSGMQRFFVPGGRDGKGKDMQRKKIDLDLTEDQKQKIKAVNDEYKIQYEGLTTRHKEELNKIYTPEQQTKLKKLRKDFSNNRPGSRFDENRGNRKFKLDEADKDKLKALRKDFDKEKKAVELSRINSDAQKQKIAALRKEYKEKRREIIKEIRDIEQKK